MAAKKKKIEKPEQSFEVWQDGEEDGEPLVAPTAYSAVSRWLEESGPDWRGVVHTRNTLTGEKLSWDARIAYRVDVEIHPRQ